jgi:ribosomal protein S18 acetylase RimI-like enzyme
LSIFVRRATVADAAELAAFGARVFAATFAKDNTADDMAMFLGANYSPERQAREIENPHTTTLLAIDGDTLVAFAQLIASKPPEIVSGDAAVEIARFYVDPAQHGRGIAQTLMDAVLDHARVAGRRTVWLGVWERNPRAIRFYGKYGFTDVGAQPFLLGRDLQTDRVMTRAL